MRKVWIGLAGLVVLLVIADFVTKAVVERQVADAVQVKYELASRPDVDIHGFPFLLQAASRQLDDVEMHADTVTVAGVDLTAAELRMHDVEVASTSSAVAQTVDGRAVLPYDQLDALADDAGSGGLSFGYGGAEDVVAVSGTVSLLGQDFDVVTFAQVSVTDSTLRLRTTRVEVDGRPAADSLVRALGDQFDLTIRVPRMFGLVRLTGVDVLPNGVQVGLSGSDIALG